jgi:hypothetical protein
MRSHDITGPRRFQYGGQTTLDIDSRAPGTVSSMPQSTASLTQARCHPDARALLARRKASGDGGMEALRILKRRLSDVVFKAMTADLPLFVTTAAA